MIEDVIAQLVDRLDSTYYGKYRGYVHDVNDPDGRGRIRVIVPRLLGAETPTGWALPCAPYAGPDQGFYTVPDVGSGVWVEFEEGDLHRPIWSGQWWGSPLEDEIGQSDSTAPTGAPRPVAASPGERSPETPQHAYPRETPTPRVRIWKSSSGHHVILDDRAESERLEIHDSRGNRIILSPDGMDRIMSNERVLDKGARSVQVDGDDDSVIAGTSKERVDQAHTREVRGNVTLTYRGNLTEQVGRGNPTEQVGQAGPTQQVGRPAYLRKVDEKGTSVSVGGALTENISGSVTRSVSGAVTETAVGGYGMSAGGGINLSSAGPVKIAAGLADLSLKAVSVDALIGNVSINTMLGMMQIGGLSAISPAVLGDGLGIHLTLLCQILKTVNPLTVAAYGPALDAWAAMTPVMDLSYFAFVKRFPVG